MHNDKENISGVDNHWISSFILQKSILNRSCRYPFVMDYPSLSRLVLVGKR